MRHEVLETGLIEDSRKLRRFDQLPEAENAPSLQRAREIAYPEFFLAIGGTKFEVGEFTYHVFLASGVFEVVRGFVDIDILLVAGGGAGGGTPTLPGNVVGGGGGAGGVLQVTNVGVFEDGGIAEDGIYAVTVGLGGAGEGDPDGHGSNGQDTVFATPTELRAFGGGSAGSFGAQEDGISGGSGGGGGTLTGAGGDGVADQGNAGAGASGIVPGGGGGGAGAVANAQNGGVGIQSNLDSVLRFYGGGGGGGINGLGGNGGGANGTSGAAAPSGTPNTGGGGGGTANGGLGGARTGGSGGSGKVAIRYRTPFVPAIISLDTFSTSPPGTLLQNHEGQLNAIWTKHPAYAAGGNMFLTDDNRVTGLLPVPTAYITNANPVTHNYAVRTTYHWKTLLPSPSDGGVLARWDAVANSGYLGWYNHALTRWEIYVAVAGVFTILGSFAQGVVINTDYIGELRLLESAITWWVDGVQRISVSNNTWLVPGRVGLRWFDSANGTNTAGLHFGDFLCRRYPV